LLFTIAACANKTTTPPPQESILYQVESFFSQKPDSALQILDTLTLGTLSEKEYAHYCLLKVRARDLLFLYDSITDSLLKVAEDFYVGGNDKWFEAQTCEALSRIAFKEGKGEQIKLDWLLKAFQSIEQCRHIDKRFLYYFKNVESEQEWIDNYRYKIQLRLGMCYVYNGYYNEGLHYLKPVNAYFSEKQKYSGWFNSAFMLGDAYLALEEYDSCRLCFENGLEAAQKLGQVENIAYYHYSMSQLYRHQFENQYYPIIFYQDNICNLATDILNNEANISLKDKKIEWGLFLRLMNDPTAVLDYKTLLPFEDIIEIDDLISDKRLLWFDDELFRLITSRADANQHTAISTYCPIEVIKKHLLSNESTNWDWIVLSKRIDENFILDNPLFQWDFEIISSREDVSIDTIKTLLLIPDLKDVEWNWI
jgi:tetratricopeptide (TPR) repeat protein